MFNEYWQLEKLLDELRPYASSEVIAHVHHQNTLFPIHQITMGSTQSNVPVIAYFGGVHGLEKIGSEVLFSYLHTLNALLRWDEELQSRLEKVRLVFVPMVNPVGVMQGTRCNGNGVDLMRNAPIEGVGKTRLHSGHRISCRLPWYRGNPEKMEVEALALCQVVRQQFEKSCVLLTLDLHSGFGIQDRLWFPYASDKKPFSGLAQVHALKTLFDDCYPNHFYQIEPVSQAYIIHGDLWDYLSTELGQTCPSKCFLPLTLEMGSWRWLRKNPLHLFRRHGLFHPVLPHRQQRILRRHLTLFDFLLRALMSPNSWADLDSQTRHYHYMQASKEWYE